MLFSNSAPLSGLYSGAKRAMANDSKVQGDNGNILAEVLEDLRLSQTLNQSMSDSRPPKGNLQEAHAKTKEIEMNSYRSFVLLSGCSPHVSPLGQQEHATNAIRCQN
jgi:hypothetical protein